MRGFHGIYLLCNKTDNMRIGANLRKYRTRINKSQRDIADLLGVERNTYANWESETADIKSSYIPQLAEIFQVEIGDLFSEKPSEIVINQTNTNTDNKEGSVNVNGVVLVLPNQESVDKLVEVLKESISKK